MPVNALHCSRSDWRLHYALVALVMGGLILAACGSSADPVATAQQQDEDGYQGMVLITPLEKPDFALPDTSGNSFDFLKETEGYVTLLYFGYTHCPDICPGQMALVGNALKELPDDVSDRVKVVYVSTDPDRDTPERLREWLDNFGETFVGLIPESQAAADEISRSALKNFWAPLTNEPLPEGGYAVNHPAMVIAYTTDNVAHVLYPFGVKKAAWLHDLPKMVKEGS
jgi:protein SCO1/2